MVAANIWRGSETLMAENTQESQGTEAVPQPEATPRDADKQSMLLKLAERTVLQAEALAQEITDHARQESEALGVKLLAEYTERAQSEAQQTVEAAQRRSETLVNKATAKAQSESEKTLGEAQSDSEKMLSKAQSDSEKMLSKARSESESLLSKARSESETGLAKAQTESQEILERARQEAQALTNASQTRADTTATNARLKAEFVVRQATQNVAEGIRSAVLEICDNLLPSVSEIENELPEAPVAGHVPAIQTAMPENGANSGESNGKEEESTAPALAHASPSIKGSSKQSGKKAKPSA